MVYTCSVVLVCHSPKISNLYVYHVFLVPFINTVFHQKKDLQDSSCVCHVSSIVSRQIFFLSFQIFLIVIFCCFFVTIDSENNDKNKIVEVKLLLLFIIILGVFEKMEFIFERKPPISNHSPNNPNCFCQIFNFIFCKLSFN